MHGRQLSLTLIRRQVDNALVEQRTADGYINATAMCQAVGKQFNDYRRLNATEAFILELSAETGIPVSELIQSLKGGNGPQGTWVHPDVAIHLAQWLSPKFAVAVSRWVREWMAGGRFTGGGALPYHIQRYVANQANIPHTHFSVLNELILNLIAPLEQQGYTLPENMVPDISQGRMFAKWLRDEKGVDTDAMPVYEHTYPDGRVCQAKLYPMEWLGDFRKHFHETWMPLKSQTYFKERDPNALPYLDRLALAPPAVALPPPPKRVRPKNRTYRN